MATAVVLHNCSQSDKNDVITDVFRAKAVLFGSPTVNRGILTSMAGLLEMIRGLKLKGKKAGAFGCYGWSGESVAILPEAAREAGFEVQGEALKALWDPDEEATARAVEFGRSFARTVWPVVCANQAHQRRGSREASFPASAILTILPRDWISSSLRKAENACARLTEDELHSAQTATLHADCGYPPAALMPMPA
jgi:flavodoxin